MSSESSEPRRAPKRWAAALLVLALALIAVPAAGATTVLVQGTTDIRDAGLLEEVIEPGFHAAYPQYEMKYIAVGTGQALTNAKAGQGDAVVTHAPSLEKTFVEEGYSLEPRGRAIFYSDYVIVGATADPAGVLAGAPHSAVKAFELIAAAGAEGKANFVSRGDNSGTNTQEKAIWKLTKGVELNKLGEPGKAGTEDEANLAPWYHRAKLGQAETVQVANQCVYTGGGCYDMTDRGTFNRGAAKGTYSGLKVVTEKNEAGALGGSNLLTNPFTVYIVNPAKVPQVSVNVPGAEALVAYLTSEAFQAGLASFPNTTSPAFFADAHPKLTAAPALAGTLKAGAPLAVSGTVANLLPGAPPVAGTPINLQRFQALNNGEAPSYMTIASGVTGASGSYSLGAVATRSGPLRVQLPTTVGYPSFGTSPLLAVGALTETVVGVGEVSVQAKIGIKRPKLNRRTVTLRGQAGPSLERDTSAKLVIQGRLQGKKKFRALRRVRSGAAAAYTVHARLAKGKWKLRVRYQDPGAVTPATSRSVSVSVG